MCDYFDNIKMNEKNERVYSKEHLQLTPEGRNIINLYALPKEMINSPGLTDLVYAQLMVQAIIANDINKPYFQAPLPPWMNARGDLRDRILKYVNMTHPSRTGHRWYLRKEWDDVLKDLIVKGEEKELVNRVAFGAFIAQMFTQRKHFKR